MVNKAPYVHWRAILFGDTDTAGVVYVPPESYDLISEAEKGGRDVKIIHNGSWGMSWLEPLVEVVTTQGRMAYGNVMVEDVAQSDPNPDRMATWPADSRAFLLGKVIMY